MRGTVYLNGQYLPAGTAGVSVFDRGWLFGDGVYEMCFVNGDSIIDEDPHLERFVRSLTETRIAAPVSLAVMKHLCRQVIRRNRIRQGHLYYHATRGVAKRDFAFPKNTPPGLFIAAWPARLPTPAVLDKGVAVITVPEWRWRRVDIKSLNLLAPVLGKQQAVEAGAAEAWQVDEQGQVTEGTSTNAWIVTHDGVLVTRQADRSILNGVTRLRLLEIAGQQGYRFEERPFTVAEAQQAREAFLSATTIFMLPVVRIDGAPVGDGTPGPLAKALREQYRQFANR
jgi:D-alanine transaminase